MNWLEAFRDGPRLDWPRLVLLALALVVVLALGVGAATSPTAFGPYNPAWDGTTEFRAQVDADPTRETVLLRDPAAYDDLEVTETVAFVVAPGPVDDADADRLRAFVEAGGTLVVLENFEPHGNELLAAVGAEARFDGQLLRDERHHYEGPPMPIATGVEPHPLTADVEQLTLNYATALEPGEATVLVTTSEYAYLGAEEDELDDDSELATYPVATLEEVGDGRVIAVGDPSVVINAMVDQPDNAAFVHGLTADHRYVAVDLTHGEGVPPLVAVGLTLRESAALQALVGLAAIGATAALVDPRGKPARKRARRWIRRVRLERGRRDRLERGRRNQLEPDRRDQLERGERNRHERASDPAVPDLTTEERLAVLRERYPDWDEERLARVIGAFNRTDRREEQRQ